MTITVCTSRFVTYTLGILMYAGHSSSKSTEHASLPKSDFDLEVL